MRYAIKTVGNNYCVYHIVDDKEKIVFRSRSVVKAHDKAVELNERIEPKKQSD